MLDPRARPPNFIRETYKRIQKFKTASDDNICGGDICDFTHNRDYTLKQFVVKDETFNAQELAVAFNDFLHHGIGEALDHGERENEGRQVPERSEECIVGTEGLQLQIYESKDLPGLQLVPSALPYSVQKTLLSRLLHRDLINPQHNNNVNLHHKLSLQPQFSSYFDISPINAHHNGDTKADDITGTHYAARDPGIHGPLSHNDFLNRKLRWITLGAQYDWTRKVYPSNSRSTDISTPNGTIPTAQQPSQLSRQSKPSIPSDVANLINALYQRMHPDAAIVNVYSPGDVLGIHRDVSEESDAGLVSISLGCDAIFVAGLSSYSEGTADSISNDTRVEAGEAGFDTAIHDGKRGKEDGTSRVTKLRLRSGDVLFMSGASRWAWHGVPVVLPGTCPPEVADWPAVSKEGKGLGVRPQREPDSGTESSTSSGVQDPEQADSEPTNFARRSKDKYEAWRGWMATKRVNLNIRQL